MPLGYFLPFSEHSVSVQSKAMISPHILSALSDWVRPPQEPLCATFLQIRSLHLRHTAHPPMGQGARETESIATLLFSMLDKWVLLFFSRKWY